MNLNKEKIKSEKNKELDGLSKAGSLISIIVSGIGIILGLIIILYMNTLDINKDKYYSIILTIKIIIIILSCFRVFAIILCSLLLKGKAKSKILAGVFSVIFSGVIGGVLILCGEYKEKKEIG